MKHNDGEVMIPVDRYDALKGLELIFKKELVAVCDYYGTTFFTNDEMIIKMDERNDLLRHSNKELEKALKEALKPKVSRWFWRK